LAVLLVAFQAYHVIFAAELAAAYCLFQEAFLACPVPGVGENEMPRFL